MREWRAAAAMIALYIAVIVGAGMHLYLHTVGVCACPFFPA